MPGKIHPMKHFFSLLIPLLAFLSSLAQQDNRGYLVRVGQRAPDDFTINLINGTTVSLKALRGKTVMLQFTASWCSVCRREIPHIEKEIWKRYQDKQFVLIGIDRDEPLDTVIAYHRMMKVSYPFALDPGALIFSRFASKDAGVTRNVLIDSSGRIVFLTRLYDPGEFRQLKAKIAQLMKD